MKHSVQVEVGGRPLIIECGRIARQASGSVVLKYGDTVVIVAATKEDRTREGIDFLPLMVDYQEMSYAAGRIPGGFFRREIGRPSEKETLTSRLIDRPIRPLFPKKYTFETQVIATVMSVDHENEPDVVALTGASAALHISPVPFQGPVAAVRVGRINGEYVINPNSKLLQDSDMNVVVAGTRDAVIMVEGGASFVSEADIAEAIHLGHQAILPILDAQDELRRLVGTVKEAPPVVETDQALVDSVYRLASKDMRDVMSTADKLLRRDRKKQLKEKVKSNLPSNSPTVRRKSTGYSKTSSGKWYER